MESNRETCQICHCPIRSDNFWCFDDLGGRFQVHENESCWPTDRTVYSNQDGEHLHVYTYIFSRDMGQFYVHEMETNVPLPDRLMANGKTFEKEWVASSGPFGESRQVDVYRVTDAEDLLALSENLQWVLMNSRRQLSGLWRIVPGQTRARKLNRLRRELSELFRLEAEN